MCYILNSVPQNVFIPCFFNFAFLYIENVFWDCGKRSCNRRTCGHVDVETCPHQILEVTLTLIQPGGGRFCPPYTDVPTKFWKPQARLCKEKTMLLEEWFRTNTERRDYQIILCYLENRSVRETIKQSLGRLPLLPKYNRTIYEFKCIKMVILNCP